jgi:nuclear transport factor 2 (NTF2) superfamily protein
MTTRASVIDWVREYERAWRSPGTERARALFSEDASYRLSPYEAPIEGLGAIAAMWDREREGPDEDFSLESTIVALDGDTAVVRFEVDYAGRPRQHYRDLWILEFDAAGKCRSFEEWPFWPGRPRIPSENP